MGNLLYSALHDSPWDKAYVAARTGDLAKLTRQIDSDDTGWSHTADEYNETIIHAAARGGHRHVCEYLLAHGSPHSPRLLFGGQETPAQIAEKCGHHELAAWLHRTQPAALFLDIDGVLNSRASRSKGCDGEDGDAAAGGRPRKSHLPTEAALACLQRIEREAGPLRIILSSTWRLDDAPRAAVEQALHTIGLTLAGSTPDLESRAAGDRVDEIEWVLRYSGEDLPWVVLDDLDLVAMNPGKLSHKNFVRTDDAVGLTTEKADHVITKLRAQRNSLREPTKKNEISCA